MRTSADQPAPSSREDVTHLGHAATFVWADAAESLLAATPQPADQSAGAQPDGMSDDFEHLRWFDLPAVCLASRS